ncbi:MAG: ABC transporter permease [Chloroflexota bacterium]|nr:ABC transporter permease [Chloroflexota bacterium]
MTTPNETTSADQVRENLIAAEPPRRPGMWKYSVYYFRHKLLGTVGLVIVITMIVIALFADLIAPFAYQQQNYEDVLAAPNFTYLFGTDNFGRDIFSRIVHGARISMLVGFLSVIVGTGIGAVVGLISGFFMGKVDAIVQRLVDMWMSFPDLILALTIVAVFGNTLPNVILAIAATILPRGVRVIRSATIAIREMDYTMAARSIGASDLRTMLRHIMPNTVAPFLIIMSSMFGTAILTEAGLSYLGLGISEPTPSWGRMLTGQAAQYAPRAPWIIAFPGIFITLTVMGFAFFGDALRDLFDPRQRGR